VAAGGSSSARAEGGDEKKTSQYSKKMEKQFKAWGDRREEDRRQWVATTMARNAGYVMRRNRNLRELQRDVNDTTWSAHLASHHAHNGAGGGAADAQRSTEQPPGVTLGITVFSMEARHKIKLSSFTCSCCSCAVVKPVALLHGYWPSTPTNPTWWIDVQLLELYTALGHRQGVGATGEPAWLQVQYV
jgi:hypothetical protein